MKSLLLSLVLISFVSRAQNYSFELWHTGKAILTSGDTLKGDIKYDLQEHLEVRHNHTVETYPSQKIIFFDFIDYTCNCNRAFYSLAALNSTSQKSLLFYELLCEGEITMLCRENLISYSYKVPSSMFHVGLEKKLIHTYYLFGRGGSIEEFTPQKKKDWYQLFISHENQIKEFVKKNNLNFDNKNDIKQIISYYNSFYNNK